MPLPQLIEEDLRVLDEALGTLVTRSESSMAILIDQAGFLITQAGAAAEFDTTTLAALAAGSFAATQSMASLTRENNYNSLYQQGDESSLFILNIDSDCLLVVVFKSAVSVGAVKYYALATSAIVAEQLRNARQRAPHQSIDLAVLYLENSNDYFHRRSVDVN